MGRKAILLVTVMAALVLVSGTAFALTYTKSKKVSLRLNKPNYVGTALTRLASNAVGPALTLKTDSTDPTSTPLRLQTETGSQPPMTVNSQTRVNNLNADKLDGKSSEELAPATHNHDDRYLPETESDSRFVNETDHTKAAHDALDIDADTLDGKNSTEFADSSHTHSGSAITSGTVAEARIDGAIARDSEVSNGYIQGRGKAQHAALALNPGQNLWFWQMSNPDLWLNYECPSNLASNGFIGIKNTSATETVNAFSDNGEQNPSYNQLEPVGSQSHPTGEFWSQGAAAAGERITFQVQGTYVATVEVFSVHRTGDNKCHVQAQALITRP